MDMIVSERLPFGRPCRPKKALSQVRDRSTCFVATLCTVFPKSNIDYLWFPLSFWGLSVTIKDVLHDIREVHEILMIPRSYRRFWRGGLQVSSSTFFSACSMQRGL